MAYVVSVGGVMCCRSCPCIVALALLSPCPELDGHYDVTMKILHIDTTEILSSFSVHPAFLLPSSVVPADY